MCLLHVCTCRSVIRNVLLSTQIFHFLSNQFKLTIEHLSVRNRMLGSQQVLWGHPLCSQIIMFPGSQIYIAWWRVLCPPSSRDQSSWGPRFPSSISPIMFPNSLYVWWSSFYRPQEPHEIIINNFVMFKKFLKPCYYIYNIAVWLKFILVGRCNGVILASYGWC